ncbi:MAG: TonB-dependent receptor plug domain-containing protein, partial [Xanthomonadaceae bacterium]|nr:TonB-dependent receptor plug domain-containing protein [Xanthomonadaceae bacterium]
MDVFRIAFYCLALGGAGVMAAAVPSAHAQGKPAQSSQKKSAKQDSKKDQAQTLSTVQVIAKELSLTRIPMGAAYSESVIGPSAIRFASPMLSVQNLLERTPSINVRSPAANSVRTNITFRAFSSGQFSETFDGVPINDPFNGGTTNTASTRNNIPLTLNDINSVNIYRGINNPAVTSYNSLGGTVAFKPREPDEEASASATLG